ncbi:MAG: monovalent cation/H+ antiporter complex subunit F [Alkalispirochaetaceae bacterium]
MIPEVIGALLLFSALCLVRVFLGPSLLDRIAATDAIGVMMAVVLVLLGLLFDRVIFLDIAIVYALLLFADTLVIAHFIERQGE